MKLYLLRHEKRPLHNPGFFTNLTDEGLKDTIKITDYFNNIDLDVVFCSPFIRTIQTIQDLTIKKNIKINIENSLYESLQEEKFSNTKNYSFNDINTESQNIYDFQNINFEYQSLLSIDTISFPDNFQKMCNRVDPFLEFLFDNFSDKSILICSHEYILRYIEFVIKNKYYSKISNFENIRFNMGEIKEFLL